ncbi:MAG: PAS domain-containing protein, partial [Cyanobacteria bacterium SZAS LIN-2]|nr:PAS domain-containing protein [Cyanobacteria bacterium SZAS LIN-2]
MDKPQGVRDDSARNPRPQPSETIQQAVFDGTATGKYAVIVTDHSQPEEPVAYVNRAFEELTGYKLAEVIGIRPHFLSSVNREQEGVIALEAAIKAGRPCSAVLRDHRKDQTPVWYQVCLEPVFNSSHELTHFFGCMRDVTLLVEAEETEKDREVFMASLAHDLRTP